MLFFVAAVVIALAIAIYWREPLSFIPLAFVGSIVALIATGITGLIFSEYYTSEPRSLVNLQDGSNVEGSFFLGIGSVGEEMKYSFYAETDSGSYKLHSVDADRAEVVFTDGDPYYTAECYRPMFGKNWDFVQAAGCYDHKNVTFYVPKGSIKTNFTLDAQ